MAPPFLKSMQTLRINNTPLTIYDNENLLLQATTEEILKLPENATLAMWPGPVGRQIINRLATLRKAPLTIYTLGRIENVDMSTYFNQPQHITITSNEPRHIHLAILTPRPTTLDVGASQKINTQQLMEEIGCIGTEQASQEITNYKSSTLDKTKQNLTEEELKRVILNADNLITIFKGDLQASACAACTEANLGFTGQIIKEKGAVFADVLSSAQLTRIAKPWEFGVALNERNVKCMFTQRATQLNKRVQDLQFADFDEKVQKLMGSDFEQMKSTVVSDLKARVLGLQDSLLKESKQETKRVLFFSPHPDDDVISAGAAMLNLCRDPSVELHVCWCVRGSVAVPDSFVQDVIDKFKVKVSDKPAVDRQSSFGVTDHQIHANMTAEMAQDNFGPGVTPDTKGTLREIEAMSAVACAGLFSGSGSANKLNRAHFLRLPFYGSGFGKRCVPGDEDVEKCFELIKGIKPNYLLLAGDLSDPHGTHGHCYDVIKKAVERYEDSYDEIDDQVRFSVFNTRKVTRNVPAAELYQKAAHRIYKFMYRGAWSEFNVQDVTFIIKMTKEELALKLKCVREHCSQMGQALYLGDDFRAFDVRAEERNQNTAKQLVQLGVLDAEAVGAECYVGCVELP